MKRYARIKGGEKNPKSGIRWSKDELKEVLRLYLSDNQLRIHESNELIIDLGMKLGRTTRSVEAQLIMFRSLDKFGYYGYRNMNKICKELWMEHIKKTTL